MDGGSQGLSAIAAAIADAGNFLGLLERERGALQKGDAGELTQVGRLKAQALVRLGPVLSLLRKPGAVSAEQRQELLALVQRCTDETQTNDALLQARAGRARRVLQALQGSPTNYDGRGLSRYGVGGLVRGAA
jgi:flagellar biosynthesis/type III secretory pathway chaperone